MKNRIIVCFMSLLGLASCSDSNDELEDTRFSDGQASSGSLVATLIDGLYDKWRAGDTILLLHDGQTAFAEAQESGKHIELYKWYIKNFHRQQSPIRHLSGR